MGRAPCCDKDNVKRGPWASEEDAKLKAYIVEQGTGGNWIALPQKIGLRRCGKSCRLRWLNYLRPNIRHGGFSEEDDNIICNLYISIGSRWSIIAAQLPGRTDNDIKNYWNTKLKKRLLANKKGQSDYHHLSSTGKDEEQKSEKRSQALSSSALERMELHMQLQGHHGPFSIYNNPHLWPKFHNLSPATPVEQASKASVTEPICGPTKPSEPQKPNFIYRSMQNEFGDSIPSENRSNLDLDSAVARLQTELHDLLYSENGSFIGWDDQRLYNEFDSLQEFDYEQLRNTANCWVNNSYENNSTPESSDSLIQ